MGYINWLFLFYFLIKMGIADAIVDLVSSGTTLRENNLKEIEGGVLLESQVNSLFCSLPKHTQALALWNFTFSLEKYLL